MQSAAPEPFSAARSKLHERADGQHLLNLLLYSTNVYLKFHIQQVYRGDIHYVWCSEQCDAKKVSTYSPGSLVAPSSNPADIYRELKRDCDRGDRHSAKIAAQRSSLTALAVKWEQDGEITPQQKDDILYLVGLDDFQMWRPLLYVIPRTDAIKARRIEVPMAKRAGVGPEFIIEDLRREEFDLIEL